MKKMVCLVAFATLGFLFPVNAGAQDSPSKRETRKKHAYERALDKDAQKKALKSARKETRMLSREGFRALPGQLPMDRQLENLWQKQMETDADGNPRWYIASSRAAANIHPTAALQATLDAKADLARQIQNNLSQIIETRAADRAIGQEEAVKLVEAIGASRSIISDALERTIPLLEVYRTLPDQNHEAVVSLGYSMDAANKVAVNAIRDELVEKQHPLAGELDKLVY